MSVFRPLARMIDKLDGTRSSDSVRHGLVVVPDDAPLERQDSTLAYRAPRGTGVAADGVIWRCAAFELTAEPPFVADVVFHAQLSAKKALKGS